jgi:predicted enzyme related to lactoylglutathione lyase
MGINFCIVSIPGASERPTVGGNHMPNPFVHVELNTTDVDKAKAFYGSLFDWTLQDVPMGDSAYTMIQPGKGTGGGMLKHPMPGAPSAWLAYVEVSDVHEATKKAGSLGAKIIKDVTEVPEMGWFSIIMDPTGAALGIWQTKAR